MPSVWSHVYIDCDKGDPVARCELWLQMARQSPLYVTFRTSEYRPKVEAAFSSILSRIDYWRTLVLEASSIYTINRLLERIISTGPLLQSISIKLGGSPVDDLLPDIVQGQARLDGFRQAFANALRLRRVSFQTDTAQSWCGVSQITSLELQLNDCQLTNARPIFFSEIFDVLSESPNLRRLVSPRLQSRLSSAIHRNVRQDWKLTGVVAQWKEKADGGPVSMRRPACRMRSCGTVYLQCAC